jgi:hypothetical protein
MKLSLALLTLFLTLSVNTGMAEVYKRTNPDGSVEFTDVPDSSKEKPVEMEPLPTFTPPPMRPTRPTRSPSRASTRYDSIAITSPANDGTIRDNAGNVSVTVTISPALRANHSLILLLDGKQQDESGSGSFRLTNIDRGTHQLQAKVVDAKGKTLLSSDTVEFHLHRTSLLNRPGAITAPK